MTNRCFLVLALVAAVFAPTSSALATPTSSDTSTSYEIDRLRADWISPTRNRAGVFPYLAVQATRRTNVDTGEVVISGVAGRGSCSDEGGSFFCSVFFRSGWRVVKFETDGAFATATVVLHRGAKRARVSWTAGAPYAYIPPYAENPTFCPDGSEGTNTTVYVSAKNATAEGRVLGRSVSTSTEHADQAESEKMIQTYETEECP